MRYGELFAGIGGMSLGLERAGMVPAWFVEIDPYCRRVLARHWPDVQQYEDVRGVGAHNLESVDLVCGGFPCQDISILGPRSGLAGKSSGLWAEFSRVVCELRPRYVLVENVPELLVRGMGRVVGDLAGYGYDAEWDVLPAAAFGANHLRARLWILAYPRGDGDRLAQRTVLAGRLGAIDSHWWTREPGVCRVDDGTPYRVDRLRTLGNAVVPQVSRWLGERIMDAANV